MDYSLKVSSLLCPWDFPGKNTGVGCHFLLQGIFLTQGSKLHLLCLGIGRWILYHCTTKKYCRRMSLCPSRASELMWAFEPLRALKAIWRSCCSVTQSCPTLCDPMDCSTPGFPVLYQLLDLPQTHVHRVSDAIQPSHPVIAFSCLQSFPASGSFPMSWLFASGGQSIGASASASVLSINIQGWFPLGLTGLISLQSKGLSRVFSSTTIQKHQFSGAQPSLWSNAYIHTWRSAELELPRTRAQACISLKFSLGDPVYTQDWKRLFRLEKGVSVKTQSQIIVMFYTGVNVYKFVLADK